MRAFAYLAGLIFSASTVVATPGISSGATATASDPAAERLSQPHERYLSERARQSEESGLYHDSAGKRFVLVEADDVVAIRYRAGEDIRQRGGEDLDALGIEMVRRSSRDRLVVVRSTRDEVQARLARHRSVDSAVESIEPVFYANGVKSPKMMITMSGRINIAFDESVGIDAREQLLRAYNLGRAEQLWGNVYTVETELPSAKIPALAHRIARQNPSLVRFAEADMHLPVSSTSTTALTAGDPVIDKVNQRGRDPLLEDTWHLHHDRRNTLYEFGIPDEDVDAPRAWNPNTRGDRARFDGYYGQVTARGSFGPSITVGVFDTGTQLQHEDFVINSADPVNLATGTTADDPRNRFITDSRLEPTNSARWGRDYIDGDLLPEPGTANDPTEAHGTAVAGLIAAARNNGVGKTGVAPSVRIYPIRMLAASDQASASDIARSVTDAATAQIEIGNHSWGGLISSQLWEDAFQFARDNGRLGLGMINFASSANEWAGMGYPALYESTYSVGAVNDLGLRVSYASFGTRLDFTGPSWDFTGGLVNPFDGLLNNRSGIVSLDIEGPPGLSPPNPNDIKDPDGNYANDFYEVTSRDEVFSGTSASCPIITGVAALILAENRFLTAPQLAAKMARTADRPPMPYEYIALDSGPLQHWVGSFGGDGPTTGTVLGNPNGFRGLDGFNHFYGYGRPNPYNALTGVNEEFSPASTYRVGQFSPSPVRDLRVAWVADFFAEAEELEPIYFAYESGQLAEEGSPNPLADFLELLQGAGQWTFSGTGLGDPEGGPRVAALEFPRVVKHPDLQARLEQTETEPGFPIYPQAPFLNIEHADQDLFSDFYPTWPTLQPADAREHQPGFDQVSFAPAFLMSNPRVGEFGADSLRYNPRQRYYPNFIYTAESPGINISSYFEIEPDGTTRETATPENTPIILEVTMKYELGTWNASQAGLGGGNLGEFDYIRFSASRNAVESPTGQVLAEPPYSIGYVIGDSSATPNLPITPPTGRVELGDDAPGVTVASWGAEPIFPEKDEINELYFRTLRYFVGWRRPGEDNIQIKMEMVTGPSYIPEYSFGDDGEISEVPSVRRDFRGFQVADMRVLVGTPEETNRRFPDNRAYKIAESGLDPAFSASGNELFFISPDRQSIQVAYADGFTETMTDQFDDGDLDDAFLSRVTVERQPITLLRTVSADGATTPPRILSLDVHRVYGDLLYVVDNPDPAKGRVFIATDDGFDERRVLDDDIGVLEAAFLPFSEEIIFTDGNAIHTTNLSGETREFVWSNQFSRLRDIRGLAVSPDESTVVFSARLPGGDFDIYAVPRSLNQPNLPAIQDPVAIVNFPGVDDLDPVFLPSLEITKDNLMFSSTVDPASPADAPASRGIPALFVLAPFQDAYGARLREQITGEPVPYSGQIFEVTMPVDTRLTGGERNFLAATAPAYHFPRDARRFFDREDDTFRNARQNISPRIAYVGFATPPQAQVGQSPRDMPFASTPGVVTSARFDILRGDGFRPDPFVFDGPIPPPPPATGPDPGSEVVRVAKYDFDIAGDGWQFNSVSGLEPALGETNNGSLQITSNNNNTNTYGFFTSPPGALPIFPFAFDGEPNYYEDFGPVTQPSGPHYVTRFYLRRTGATAEAAPTMRLRLNSNDGQNYHELVLNSIGDAQRSDFLARIPDETAPTPVDLVFQPPRELYDLPSSLRAYYLSFDLLNFSAPFNVDSPVGGYIIDRVDIFRVPVRNVDVVANLGESDFNTAASKAMWEPRFIEGAFEEPVLFDGGRSLGAVVNNPVGAYGYWQSLPGAFSVNLAAALQDYDAGPGARAFARLQTLHFANDADPLQLPEQRVRVATGDWSAIATQGLVPIGSGSLNPSLNDPRILFTYLELLPGSEPQNLHAAWDILSFLPNPNVSGSALYLENARIDLVMIENYPPVENIPPSP